MKLTAKNNSHVQVLGDYPFATYGNFTCDLKSTNSLEYKLKNVNRSQMLAM